MKKVRNEKLSFEKLTVVLLSNVNMKKIMGGLTTEGTDDPDTTTGYHNGGDAQSTGIC